MDLFREVPQELVKIWEAKNLGGLESPTLEAVYAEWRRLKFKITVAKTYLWIVITLTAVLMVTSALADHTTLIKSNPKVLFNGLLVTTLVMACGGWLYYSRDRWIDLKLSEGRYSRLLRDFQLRMDILMVLGENSFHRQMVIAHLRELARKLACAQANYAVVTPNTCDKVRGEFTAALSAATEEFEPYFQNLRYFNEYFGVPNRKKLFDDADRHLKGYV